MDTYLDDLIAYKSLYLLIQNKRDVEEELADLKKSAESRCKNYKYYPQAKEKIEETSLAKITDEMFIIRKIKNMIGHIRMHFAKEKTQTSEPTQQEEMAKLQLERYEKVVCTPNQIREILGRDIVMKILGMDINEFVKETKIPSKNAVKNKIIENER